MTETPNNHSGQPTPIELGEHKELGFTLSPTKNVYTAGFYLSAPNWPAVPLRGEIVAAPSLPVGDAAEDGYELVCVVSPTELFQLALLEKLAITIDIQGQKYRLTPPQITDEDKTQVIYGKSITLTFRYFERDEGGMVPSLPFVEDEPKEVGIVAEKF